MPDNQTFKPSYLEIVPTIIFLGGAFLFIGLPSLIFSPLMGLLMIIGIAAIIFFMILSIKLTSYELHPDGLFIKKGIIAKKQILLLYTQIQDVTEYRNLWSRIAGLKALQIKTMTATSAFAGNLRYITEADADILKKLLLQQVNNRSKTASQKSSKTSTPNKTASYDIDKEQNENDANPYPVNFHKIGFVYTFICIIMAIILIAFIVPAVDDTEIFLNLFWIIIFILSVPIRYFIQQVTFKYWVSDNTITIKSGLISTQKTSIEYEKVQDFMITQGVIERILGLAKIHLETGSVEIYAGNDKKQIPNYEIMALKLEDAKTLSNKIMKKVDINYTPLAKPLVEGIPLDKNKVLKKTFSGAIALFILLGLILGIFGIITLNNSDMNFTTVLIWIVSIFIVLTILTLIYQKMYYDRYFYDWSKDTLTIRKGVIGKRQIYLRFEKIQNVFMDQDLLDRIFGIYDVHVSTVGHGSIHMCHIDGLNKENANKMLAVLLKQVKANS